MTITRQLHSPPKESAKMNTMSLRTSRIATICSRATNGLVKGSKRQLVLPCFALANRPDSETRTFSSFARSDGTSKSSPFASNSSPITRTRARRKLKFVPQKAAVALTPKARNFFKALLESTSNPDVVGIMLNYHQSSTGEPRMVFSFDFAKTNQLTDQDEGYANADVKC